MNDVAEHGLEIYIIGYPRDHTIYGTDAAPAQKHYDCGKSQ